MMAKKKKASLRPFYSPPPENNQSDYTTGEDRCHQFYISSGDLVIQVCQLSDSVIKLMLYRWKRPFSIHPHFLTMQSEVFSDMIIAPRVESSTDGTESKPLVLSGDRVDS